MVGDVRRQYIHLGACYINIYGTHAIVMVLVTCLRTGTGVPNPAGLSAKVHSRAGAYGVWMCAHAHSHAGGTLACITQHAHAIAHACNNTHTLISKRIVSVYVCVCVCASENVRDRQESGSETEGESIYACMYVCVCVCVCVPVGLC